MDKVRETNKAGTGRGRGRKRGEGGRERERKRGEGGREREGGRGREGEGGREREGEGGRERKTKTETYRERQTDRQKHFHTDETDERENMNGQIDRRIYQFSSQKYFTEWGRWMYLGTIYENYSTLGILSKGALQGMILIQS